MTGTERLDPCRWRLAVSLAVLCSLPGCMAMYEAGVPGMSNFVDIEAIRREQEEYRLRFQSERDPVALNWLLQNRVKSGMELYEVEEILGVDSEREHADRWIKTSGGPFRQGDEVYRWGPDSRGRTLYLVFRNKKLVGYNPDDPDFSLGR